MIYLSKSSEETRNIAKKMFNFAKIKHGKAIVIALEGELGAGKTVFVKGFAKALGIRAKIKSPTFNLIKCYPIDSRFLYHLDCYRLRDHRDLKILGIKEILNSPENIVLIEWSDRVKKILPRKHIKIHIDHIDKNTRRINIKMYNPPSLKLRKDSSSFNEEMLALRGSEGAKK